MAIWQGLQKIKELWIGSSKVKEVWQGADKVMSGAPQPLYACYVAPGGYFYAKMPLNSNMTLYGGSSYRRVTASSQLSAKPYNFTSITETYAIARVTSYNLEGPRNYNYDLYT